MCVNVASNHQLRSLHSRTVQAGTQLVLLQMQHPRMQVAVIWTCAAFSYRYENDQRGYSSADNASHNSKRTRRKRPSTLIRRCVPAVLGQKWRGLSCNHRRIATNSCRFLLEGCCGGIIHAQTLFELVWQRIISKIFVTAVDWKTNAFDATGPRVRISVLDVPVARARGAAVLRGAFRPQRCRCSGCQFARIHQHRPARYVAGTVICCLRLQRRRGCGDTGSVFVRGGRRIGNCSSRHGAITANSFRIHLAACS